MKLWIFLFFIVVFCKSSTGDVSCNFNLTAIGETRCIIRSYNMRSENEQLQNINYDFYKPYVTSLYSYYSNIPFIPTDFFQLFPNVKTVEIINSNLLIVTRNTFKNGKQIQKIDLMNNLVSSISPTAFVDCASLIQLNLRNNRLTTFDITTEVPNLNDLNLAHNQIFAVNPGFFANVPALSRLDLTGNSCVDSSFYKSTPWITLSSIVDYKLAHCYHQWANMPTTTPSPFSGNSKECSFSNHPVHGYTCALRQVKFVESGDLSYIIRNHLPGKCDNDVVRVVFTSSTLVRIPPVIFQTFRNLQSLDASSSKIKLADANTIESCPNLKHLELYDNDIDTIEDEFLANCKNLVSVNLEENFIWKISPFSSLLTGSFNLKQLLLEYNNCVSYNFYDQNLSKNFATVLKKPLQKCLTNYLLGDDALGSPFSRMRRGNFNEEPVEIPEDDLISEDQKNETVAA